MPFKDKEFDYVICSHVLEHVDDVGAFVNELMRVAGKGYIEFPTVCYEYLYDFAEHKNYVGYRHGEIVWMKKEDIPLDSFRVVTDFFKVALNSGYADIVQTLKRYMVTGFEWHGHVGVRYADSISDLLDVPSSLERRRCFRVLLKSWLVRIVRRSHTLVSRAGNSIKRR